MSAARTARAPSKDQVLSGAVEVARSAAEDVAIGGHVGDHTGFELHADRVGTHYFASQVPGYQGWRWAVTVARVPRGRTPSVSEVELVPGDGALLAPAWVPWADRLRPGDLGTNDVLPYVAEDDRLVQGYEFTGEEDDAERQVAEDLGLARARVLSPRGRAEAMQRWYEGAAGPDAPVAKNAAGPCSSCGFFMQLAGTARTMFGVCANEWSPDDGRVVALDHGCGAHSETRAPEPAPLWDATPPVRDEADLIVLPPLNPVPEEPAEVEETDEASGKSSVEKPAGAEEPATGDDPAPQDGPEVSDPT
ncbi:DUF3027 domain-containing protein [Georgenia sp. Z1344]|uniref:DUF3027 domain-containing protein n=1 Tax=Georgenia sp. Z1344 TaxID=3416706 RepID=UPI003CE7C4EE